MKRHTYLDPNVPKLKIASERFSVYRQAAEPAVKTTHSELKTLM